MKLLLHKIVDGPLIATYGPNVWEIVSRIKWRQLTTEQMSHFLVKYEILRRLQSSQDFRVSKYFVNIFMSKMWLTRQTFGYYRVFRKTRILIELSFRDRNLLETKISLFWDSMNPWTQSACNYSGRKNKVWHLKETSNLLHLISEYQWLGIVS